MTEAGKPKNPIEALPLKHQGVVTKYIEKAVKIPGVHEISAAFIDDEMVLVATTLLHTNGEEIYKLADVQWDISHSEADSPQVTFVDVYGKSSYEKMELDKYISQGINPIPVFQREK